MSVIAIPWTILGALLIIWDLVQNIYFNKGWAGANPFLIINTIYGVLQYVISIFVVWEIDPILRYLDILRIIALVLSGCYIVLWLSGLIQYMIVVFSWDGKESTASDMYAMMVLAQNLFIYLSYLPVSLILIVKEISMEFY